MDWRGACIVPLYKGKGEKCECSSSSGISLLRVVGKLYCKVLIAIFYECTFYECMELEENC